MNALLTTSAAVGHATGNGARGLTAFLFGSEMLAIIMESRWVLFLMLTLVIADFILGRKESSRHYAHSKAQGDRVRMDYFRWHWSRAVRRTFNKLVDYILIMLVCQAIGMAIFEPLGINHTWGAWAGGIIACSCELSSIFGHFFYLRGVRMERRTVSSFCKTLLIAIAKRKDETIGESLEEAFGRTEDTQDK